MIFCFFISPPPISADWSDFVVVVVAVVVAAAAAAEFVDDTYMTGGRTTTQKQPQLGAGTPRGHSLTMALARHEDTPTLENLSVMPAPSACIGAITAEVHSSCGTAVDLLTHQVRSHPR